LLPWRLLRLILRLVLGGIRVSLGLGGLGGLLHPGYLSCEKADTRTHAFVGHALMQVGVGLGELLAELLPQVVKLLQANARRASLGPVDRCGADGSLYVSTRSPLWSLTM
jgi:hypothetical protein